MIRPETFRERIDEIGDYEISVDAHIGWLSFSVDRDLTAEFSSVCGIQVDGENRGFICAADGRLDPDEGDDPELVAVVRAALRLSKHAELRAMAGEEVAHG